MLPVEEVEKILPEALEARRRCLLTADIETVRFDGIPTIGEIDSFNHANDSKRCFSCYESQSRNCCKGSDASQMYAIKGSACDDCMPMFQKWRDKDVCLAATSKWNAKQCRLNVLV